jgi:catechol 2,3-dioxygenase-like lactoylglutathione lyase family enzyme
MTASQFGAIGQLSRSVADIGAAEAWWRDVLGMPHLYTYGPLAFFDCGGVRLMLSAESGQHSQANVIYFRVPDIHASHAELSGRGVVFIQAPHMIHRHPDGMEEWMAFFSDNEGRPLAIMSQVRPD